MPNKAKVETKLIDIASAFGFFQEQENLLALLREGTLIAVGRYQWVLSEPADLPVSFVEIPVGAWCDYRFVEGNNVLTNDDEYFYSAIHLNREALNQCLEGADADSTIKNRGGRPHLYDWDALLPDLINSAFEVNPTSLDAWVNRCLGLSIWKKGQVPDQSTLRRKLKPYYQKLFSGSG